MAELNVDGESYEIFQLTGRQGLTWPYKLAKYMRGFVPQDGANVDLDKAFMAFFQECSESDFVSFAEGMLDTVHFQGKSMKGLYTVKFAGNIAGLFKLLVEICKFHFSGFFSALQGYVPSETVTEKTVVKGTIRD